MKPTQPPEGRRPLELLEAAREKVFQARELAHDPDGWVADRVAEADELLAALRTALERQEPERVERAGRWLCEWGYEPDEAVARVAARRLLAALEGGEP